MNKIEPIKINRGLLILILGLLFLGRHCFAQTPDELEFSLEVSSPTVKLPKIYKSNIDLSGRGRHRDASLPQALASKNTLDAWQADLGFSNFYRLQYNLWEIQELALDPVAQNKLLDNYEEIIKKISDSGGVLMLNLFGTPNGLGRVMDSNSAPYNLKAYKILIKNTIRRLSCEKKYNIWYEVWTAPDVEDFFLGERSEYLNLYRVIGEVVKELEQETKINIPLGGPSVSAWFRSIHPNNILTPEGSLIYELIKYCYNYRLPLDFISWHAYSSDPQEEQQDTIYHKSFIKLIREWLSYFRFDNNLPLVVSEWNFDGAANILAARSKKSYIGASYIPARLKHMYAAGLDYQAYFCLEDFAGNPLGANRNLGAYSFDPNKPESPGQSKAGYNIFRMFNLLGEDLFTTKFNDEFLGVIATKSPDYLAILIYNYIDPHGAMNYLSRNIVHLNSAERKSVLMIIKSDRMEKVLSGKLDIATLRLSPKAKTMFSRAIELQNLGNKFSGSNRKLKISLKGLKDTYVFSQYTVDSSCGGSCEFKSTVEQDIAFNQEYAQVWEVSPYSAQLLVFKKKPEPPGPELPPAANLTNVSENEIKVETKPEEKALVIEKENAQDR